MQLGIEYTEHTTKELISLCNIYVMILKNHTVLNLPRWQFETNTVTVPGKFTYLKEELTSPFGNQFFLI